MIACLSGRSNSRSSLGPRRGASHLRSGGSIALATTLRIDVKRRAADGTIVEGKIKLADRVQADDVIYIREGRF